tara:strand:+ start:282 stop:587 length:306 start_codon:yes stop_codon:yes gene_type:complete
LLVAKTIEKKIDLSWSKYKKGSMGEKNCPVCGENYEFYEEISEETGGGGIQIMHDIDKIWEVEENIRWNRICHRIGTKSDSVIESNRLVVETFRHHHGEVE